MTTWTHGLLTFAIFQPIHGLDWKKAVWWAIFPDLFWAIPLGIYLLMFHIPIPHEFNQAPSWFYILYGLGHSFVISGLSITVVYWWKKKFSFEMLAWPLLHIIPDVPGHTHFQTPFLFSLSNYSIHGLFSWSHIPWNIASYAVPLGIIAITFLYKKLKAPTRHH